MLVDAQRVTSDTVVLSSSHGTAGGVMTVCCEALTQSRCDGGTIDPLHANSIIGHGDADLVALARAFLADPRWSWRAADTLGAAVEYPPQYLRAKGMRTLT
jgi:2,4-dienoyl-CoA reductase-like NADH-dependent reductase (Old Yellow Enzyme family)